MWRCEEPAGTWSQSSPVRIGYSVEAKYSIDYLTFLNTGNWKYNIVRVLNEFLWKLPSVIGSSNCLEINPCLNVHTVSHLIGHIALKVHALSQHSH